jgi:hypothetical protein
VSRSSSEAAPTAAAQTKVPARGAVQSRRAALSGFGWLPSGFAAAAVVVLVAVFSGTVESTDQTLVLMGFDPDRAQLITALILGGVAAAMVTLVVDRVGFATLLGLGSLVVLYAQTFGTETTNAVGSNGATGVFDPLGWMLTLATLTVIGALSGWAGATLAAALRPPLISTLVAARDLVTSRPRNPRLVRRPIVAVIVIVVLAVTVPAFGDMVNLSPDALMLNGGQHNGLIPGDSFPAVSPGAPASPTPSSAASPTSSPGAGGSPATRATFLPGSEPWLAWQPQGLGNMVPVDMAAPWVGGSRNVSGIDVYTPPGYSDTGDRRYPVVYEAPTGFELWQKGTNITAALDDLIDSGRMPAAIVVFIDSIGAPVIDSQCADTPDKKQWFETYISQTVVQYVDRRFHTIMDPSARAIMGMSAGGFCAPMLALRHPDVFGTAISFSGYFWAGAAGPNSATPFGKQADLDAHSPALLAPKYSGDRSKLYFVVIAKPDQGFYGPAANEFDAILSKSGFNHLAVASTYTHGWQQVRNETPGALEAWAARMVISGVW